MIKGEGEGRGICILVDVFAGKARTYGMEMEWNALVLT